MADEQKNEQNAEQKVEQKRRNSYADLGLMIAVTLLIVTILRCLIFGISWEDSFFIVLAVAYCFVSHKYDSESKFIKNSTTGLLLVTVVALATIIIIDRKPQPKMHAFEGAKTDTVPEEQFIQKEEPKVPELDSDTVVVLDTLANVDEATEESAEGTEGEETQEQTEENTEE